MKASEIKIKEYYGNLKAIVEQLEFCEYENQAGFLKMNIAFIALKKMAHEDYAEKEAIDFGYKLLHDVRCDLGSDNMPDTWTKEDVKYKYLNQKQR